MTSAQRTCRKRRFRDEYEAAKKLKQIAARAARGEVRHKIPVRYYDCPFCGGFHLTSRLLAKR